LLIVKPGRVPLADDVAGGPFGEKVAAERREGDIVGNRRKTALICREFQRQQALIIRRAKEHHGQREAGEKHDNPILTLPQKDLHDRLWETFSRDRGINSLKRSMRWDCSRGKSSQCELAEGMTPRAA